MAIELTSNKPCKSPPPLTINGLSVIWAGEWSSTKTYYKNQAVSYKGSSYRANDTTTQEPSQESTEWDVLALAGTNGSGGGSGTGVIQGSQFRLSALNTAPASATATGTLGEIRYDANYMYVCTATNTWKRSALTTW